MSISQHFTFQKLFKHSNAKIVQKNETTPSIHFKAPNTEKEKLPPFSFTNVPKQSYNRENITTLKTGFHSRLLLSLFLTSSFSISFCLRSSLIFCCDCLRSQSNMERCFSASNNRFSTFCFKALSSKSFFSISVKQEI